MEGLFSISPESTPLIYFGVICLASDIWRNKTEEGKEQLNPMAQNAYFCLIASFSFLSPSFTCVAYSAQGLLLSYLTFSRFSLI